MEERLQVSRMGHQELICRACGTELNLLEVQKEDEQSLTCPNCESHTFGL